jgi:hypothetical protein
VAGAEAHISTQRFAFVDALRGLAALSVVLYHASKAAISPASWAHLPTWGYAPACWTKPEITPPSTSRRHCCDSTFRDLKPTLRRRRTPQSADRHSGDTLDGPVESGPIEDVPPFERSPFGSPRVPGRQIVESNGLIPFQCQDLAGVRADIASPPVTKMFFVTALFTPLSHSKQRAPFSAPVGPGFPSLQSSHRSAHHVPIGLRKSQGMT